MRPSDAFLARVGGEMGPYAPIAGVMRAVEAQVVLALHDEQRKRVVRGRQERLDHSVSRDLLAADDLLAGAGSAETAADGAALEDDDAVPGEEANRDVPLQARGPLIPVGDLRQVEGFDRNHKRVIDDVALLRDVDGGEQIVFRLAESGHGGIGGAECVGQRGSLRDLGGSACLAVCFEVRAEIGAGAFDSLVQQFLHPADRLLEDFLGGEGGTDTGCYSDVPLCVETGGKAVLQLLVGEVRVVAGGDVPADGVLALLDFHEKGGDLALTPLGGRVDRRVHDRERYGRRNDRRYGSGRHNGSARWTGNGSGSDGWRRLDRRSKQ